MGLESEERSVHVVRPRRALAAALAALALAVVWSDSPSRLSAQNAPHHPAPEVADHGRKGPPRAPIAPLHERFPALVELNSVAVDPDALPRAKAVAPAPVPGVVSGSDFDRDSSSAPALGFAGGRFEPAPGIDPALRAFAESVPGAATYAFLVLRAPRLAPDVLDLCESLSVKVLGLHSPGAFKIRLAAADLPALEAIASHPDVHWIGFARERQNVDPALEAMIAARHVPAAVVGVAVSLFEADPEATIEPAAVSPVAAAFEGSPAAATDRAAAAAPLETWLSRGPMLDTLESLGFEPVRLEPALATYVGSAPLGSIGPIAGLPFVLYVEKLEEPALAHDASMPLVGLDSARAIASGADVSLGIVDSGFASSHADLGAYTIAWDLTGENDPFRDDCRHGSHVAGTMLGRGLAEARYRGGAPGAALRADRRLFAAKIFSKNGTDCVASGDGLLALSLMQSPYTDANGVTSPAPEIVNGSWGVTGGSLPGTDVYSRTADSMVFLLDQCAVFAAGNEGSSPATIRSPAVAKNVIAVGSVLDHEGAGPGSAGSVHATSSRGFSGDGRIKPDVVAPGRMIRSVLAGSASSYGEASGTSMATPHVTAALASALDELPWLRRDPSRARAFLLSQAMLRNDDPWHDWRSYGFGRVEAYRLHRSLAGPSGWRSGSAHGDATSTAAGGFDLDVPPGTARIVLVLCWDEPPASAGSDRAVLYDLDLVLDSAPADGTPTGGDFFSASHVANTEFLVIERPPAGLARVKIVPYQVPPGVAVHFDVAWAIHAGSTRPGGPLVATTDARSTRPGTRFDVVARVESDGGIASGVVVEVAGDATLVSSETTLKDGAVAAFPPTSNAVVVGDVNGGEAREVRFTLVATRPDATRVVVRARSENWGTREVELVIPGEGFGPSLPTGFTSPTHPAFAWTRSPDVRLTWSPPAFHGSGLAGYNLVVNRSAATIPGAVVNVGPVVEAAVPGLTSGPLPFFAHIRPIDVNGRAPNDAAHFGPFYVDFVAPRAGNILVNGGDAFTSRSFVDVELRGADDGESGLAGGSIRLANDGSSWSSWAPFSPVIERFELPPPGGGEDDGLRTVFAQVRDAAGNLSSPVFDTIMFRPDQIKLLDPPINSTPEAPPTFRWIDGPCDIFAVQLSTDGFATILAESYRDYGDRVLDTRWTLPQDVWNALVPGVPVEWRVKGTLRSDPSRPRRITTSVDTFRFFR